MMTIYGKTSLQTDNAVLTDLIATRGMSGMMNTIWLILCAMCFGGAMTASGMLGSITSLFVRFMKKTVSVVSATVCSGLFLNLATADQYISIILTGNMFRDIYAKRLRKLPAQPDHRGFSNHYIRTDSVEYLRDDTSHYSERAYAGVPPLLLFQHYQSFNEYCRGSHRI